MIVALILIALLQDGPVRTAPTPQESADPGPICTFGGRPVHSPQCPTPEGRTAFVTATEPPPVADAGVTRIEDCRASATRRPSETELACVFRVRREVAARQAEAVNEEDANPWDAVNRSPSAQANVGEGRYSRYSGAAATPESGVPGWALTDPARWEASQCGADGDDACRRQARNRLAMARAGVAAEPDAATGGGQAAAPQNCRMVMQRSASGFGGSLSRVCGDAAEAEAALVRLEESLRPVVQPCDQPATLESQDAWIARCRALPPR